MKKGHSLLPFPSLFFPYPSLPFPSFLLPSSFPFSLPPPHMRRQQEALLNYRKRTVTRSNYAGPLILHFQSPELSEGKFLFFMLWYWVTSSGLRNLFTDLTLCQEGVVEGIQTWDSTCFGIPTIS